jgi:hypothetical protein
MAAKMASERYTINMMDKPGGLVHFKVNSKYMPMEETIKFGEEYTMTFPGMGEYRCIDTLCGDTIVNVSKGPKYTTKSWSKFGNNFVVMVSDRNHIKCIYIS